MSTFWLEDIKSLFTAPEVVPMGNMSLQEQMNAMTRLVLILFAIMLLLNFKYSTEFLVISMAFIIIIYYIQRKKMQNSKSVENFNYSRYSRTPIESQAYNLNNLKKAVRVNGSWEEEVEIESPQNRAFCNDQVSIDPPSNFAVSLNQNLAYGVNPKPRTGKPVEANLNDATQLSYGAHPVTRIKPVVPPPAYALDYWRDNNLIVYSQINTSGPQEDMYLSGYAESTCCGYLGNGAELIPTPSKKIQTQVGGNMFTEDYSRGIRSPYPADERPAVPNMPVRENYIRSPYPADERPAVPTMPVRENYNNLMHSKYADLTTVDNPQEVTILPNEPGWVDTSCGYNPQQVYRSGLPSNYPAGNCVQDPKLKRYNENLFTQTVTPGVYTRSQVIEPINSNIGISYQQQFEPVTCKRDEKGLQYTAHDPRIVEPAEDEPPAEIVEQATYDNVYDPRFYGYGTSYRSYLDPNTGQTRFIYDDVNAIRMPNYITRSKIDHLPYADSYGPVKEGSEFGNVHNPNIRALAQDSWMRDSLQFRNDITERRMRKINADAWQRRVAPLGPRMV